MMRLWITGEGGEQYQEFIESCIKALFESDAKYDIEVNLRKFVDGEDYEDGTHSGFCNGGRSISTIEIATHGVYECGEEYAYQPFEIASTMAHELTHARQFSQGQINMLNYVWRNNGKSVNCVDIEYEDQPWEVEAYAYESILADIFWEEA